MSDPPRSSRSDALGASPLPDRGRLTNQYDAASATPITRRTITARSSLATDELTGQQLGRSSKYLRLKGLTVGSAYPANAAGSDSQCVGSGHLVGTAWAFRHRRPGDAARQSQSTIESVRVRQEAPPCRR